MTTHSDLDRPTDPAPIPRVRRRLRRRDAWREALPRVRRAVITGSVALVILVVVLLMVRFWPGRDAPGPPWFAGYTDVTVAPAYAFESSGAKDVVLSFVVASPADPCLPSWGHLYNLDDAGRQLKLDERVKAMVSGGGRIGVSFGGSVNQELANACKDQPALTAAYRSVLRRYSPTLLDFDIEGDNLLDSAAGQRRAQAIRQIQTERGPLDKGFGVWLTLPASPRGLTDAGIAAVEQMLAAGVELTGVNIMTMNYGESRTSPQSMVEASESAAAFTHDQLDIIYQRAGINLSSSALWSKIGLTPMIGQNDFPNEVFSTDAAATLRDYAVSKGVQRLSMWSLNRDSACPPGNGIDGPDHACSGVEQLPGQFARILGSGMAGRMN